MNDDDDNFINQNANDTVIIIIQHDSSANTN